MVVSILTSLLTGAVLVLFLENQHLEKEITLRFHSIMKPFYHKLTLFSLFVQECQFCFRYTPRDTGSLDKRLIDDINYISRLASRSIIHGGDIPLMSNANISSTCEKVNDIWYIADRYHDFYSLFVSLRTYNKNERIEKIKTALLKYDTKYIDKGIDIYTLPEVAGCFYVEDWQPVQNVTAEYEYWQERCEIFQRLSLFSIGSTTFSLFCLLLFPEYSNHTTFICLTAISLFFFMWCLIELYKLMTISKKILL